MLIERDPSPGSDLLFGVVLYGVRKRTPATPNETPSTCFDQSGIAPDIVLVQQQ